MSSKDKQDISTATPINIKLEGLASSRGVVAGPVFIYRSADSQSVPEHSIAGSGVGSEIDRLMSAFESTQVQLRQLTAELSKRLSKNEALIFEGHLMMAADPTFQDACKKEITDNLINAEWAVSRAAAKIIETFDAMDDSYLQERAKDVEDVSRRIIRNLMGREGEGSKLEEPCIIVADELTPSDTISIPKHLILGFATDRGSTTSHASVLARALGIPAVVGIKKFSSMVRNGDYLLLDGTRGVVVVNPGCVERHAFERLIECSMAFERSVTPSQEPAIMADGTPIALLANVDHSTPISEVLAVGAQGVGLYRSEYLWLSMGREPTEVEQAAAYGSMAKSLSSNQSLVIRVLDLGGDKVGRGAVVAHREANPFLGNRSIRFLLRNPGVFRAQLAAILRASTHGNVSLMYPMITTLEELIEANKILEETKEELCAIEIPFNKNIKKGVMIEVPSAVLAADSLAKHADFFSIGTNDLIQYAMATDRLNENVANLYQPTYPAILRLIEMSIEAAHRNNIPIAVCGEMASDPFLAILLIGLGIDELSMSYNLIPLVKRVLKHVTIGQAQELADHVRSMCTSGSSANEIMEHCRKSIRDLAPDLACIQ